ncbi:Similar to Altered inheritance of mitochondria protein 18, mitochondrial; acc. no. Q6BN19 [Pyronema omphalodes CBS 100304]|uniref:Similar to Altered inheritance of mitochondria protein 18, mitochondrial acc. no. Q6BN19 n=1 Tax=Pyronema omphalodes (strain CBS 100304) TaxID=1076935 RepID=U4LJ79_PYROM|nr:Similar to Altered inheritance of mitochondria protein 18, mitochondrial; acc. no. Q6BN19 [Pyronema omphalodes CBS 100304]
MSSMATRTARTARRGYATVTSTPLFSASRRAPRAPAPTFTPLRPTRAPRTPPRWIPALGASLGASLLILAATSSSQLAEAPATSIPIAPGTPIIAGDAVDAKLVPSGTTSVPPFPRSLTLEGHEEGDYELVGLGIRTVSFLNIQVYVLGFYVHKEDLAELQKEILRLAGPRGASSLTIQEQEEVRGRLLDTKEGEEVWEQLLQEGKWRSVVRVVPTRNTAPPRRLGPRNPSTLYQASLLRRRSFHELSLSEFKALFGGAFKKSVPKQKTLLLCRGKEGEFSVYYDPTGRNDGKFGGEGEEKFQTLGAIKDPRISKALWLCYLAGAKPASASARESIVDGVLNMTQRPAETLRA